MSKYDMLKEGVLIAAQAPGVVAGLAVEAGMAIGNKIERSHMAKPPVITPHTKKATHAGHAKPKHKLHSPCGPN